MAQPAAETDTVELSKKSMELAAAAKTDTASRETETPKVATTATKKTRVADTDDAAKANAEKSTEKTKEASESEGVKPLKGVIAQKLELAGVNRGMINELFSGDGAKEESREAVGVLA
ncbi:MAG: hypothetical protein MAG551_00446 [Candidatus Scalindua arabica]|uniref:Uncharacterized protein n=1 Tax=Candidatus Scalindua arabica TaxID=1127984 RepID=A0A941VZK2_9BACT|nr:hypothetical protein [Candidatus Scalindua arabica]